MAEANKIADDRLADMQRNYSKVIDRTIKESTDRIDRGVDDKIRSQIE